MRKVFKGSRLNILIKMKVAPHTSLKHRMLGMYFLICRQVAKSRILYYVDLFAGDGEAECNEAPSCV